MFKNLQTEIVTEVKWPSNGFMLRTSQYKIDVPNGVPSSALRMPNYVDVSGMSAALRSGSTLAQGAGGQLGSVNGLVTSQLTLRFADQAKQWKSRCVGEPNRGPVEFTFQGGKVHFALALGIFVLNPNKPSPGDEVSDRIFSVIYSHELLHVVDNLDMLNNWLPPRLKQIRVIDEYLIRRKPYLYGRAVDSLDGLTREFPEFVRNKIETEAHNLWAVEANQRQAIRDAPQEYGKVQGQINDLRSSRTIRRR
ncbi:MAG: hypothetical protein PSX80_09995 [bacterium]|nr:hypothetical protein [bacterium]